jgi:hypothetical protein
MTEVRPSTHLQLLRDPFDRYGRFCPQANRRRNIDWDGFLVVERRPASPHILLAATWSFLKNGVMLPLDATACGINKVAGHLAGAMENRTPTTSPFSAFYKIYPTESDRIRLKKI